MKDIWTMKYRPVHLDEVLGNDESVDMIRRLVLSGNLPHLVLHGPENSGKCTTALAMARELYGESYERNFTYFNASDFFEQGKRYLVRDKRFLRIIGTDDPSKISKSVITLFKEIVNEYAGMGPIDAGFKIIFIDNTETFNADAQHALRRIMEKYTATCRFVLSTTQPSKLIAPLRSRGLQLFFRYVSDERLGTFLRDVADKEGLSISDDGIDALVYNAKGNVANALHALQLISLQSNGVDIGAQEVYEHSMKDRSENMTRLFQATLAKDLIGARKAIDDLILEDGMSGQEILLQLHEMAVSSTENDATIANWVVRIADTDMCMTDAASDRIQLEALVAGFFQ